MEAIRLPLALRLNRTIGGQHFQVAERALLLWNSERFLSLMLENAANRGVVLPVLFPALFSNQEQHWHESIRNLSSRILERYAEVDPELVERCGAELEARLESDARAAEALAAASAAVLASGGGVGDGNVAGAGGDGSGLVDAMTGLSLSAAASGGGGDAAAGGVPASPVPARGGDDDAAFAPADSAAAAAAGHAAAASLSAPLHLAAPPATPPLTPRGGGGTPSTPSAAAAGVALGMHSAGLLTGHGAVSHLAPLSPGVTVPGSAAAAGSASAAAAAATPGSTSAGGIGAASASPSGGSTGGGGVLLPHTGHGHMPHRAPAVRGPTVFSVQSDILPAHARGGGGVDGVTPGKREAGGHRPLMMGLPLAGGEGGGEGDGE